MPGIRAITFDLWDTVFVDDSDEPKRTAQGLPPKASRAPGSGSPIPVPPRPHRPRARRLRLRHRGLRLPRSLAQPACHMAGGGAPACSAAGLKRELPAAEFEELVEASTKTWSSRIRPDLVRASARAIDDRSRKIHPDSDLGRHLLARPRAARNPRPATACWTFLRHSSSRTRSVVPSPTPAIFQKAATGRCRLDEIVHIGDREHNDIAGAREAWRPRRAVTAAIDRGGATHARRRRVPQLRRAACPHRFPWNATNKKPCPPTSLPDR